MSEDLPLAAEFPAVSHAQWRALVEAALKGADFDKRLVSHTYDGLRVEPLYPRAERAAPVAGRAAVPWQVMASASTIPTRSKPTSRRWSTLKTARPASPWSSPVRHRRYGYGLPTTEAAVAQVLDGVILDAGVAIEFESSPAAHDVPAHHRRAAEEARHRSRQHDHPFGLG